MMMFSKACEYGIRSAVYIAEQSQSGYRVSLKDIAREIDSPEAFTAKILQQLARHRIIDSVKGAAGGFEIPAGRLNKVKLSDIVVAIDGDDIFKSCVLGLKDCSGDHPCPVHHKFKDIRNNIKQMLQKTTLIEMSSGVKEGRACLRF